MDLIKKYFLPIIAFAFFSLLTVVLLSANLGWNLSVLKFKDLMPHGDKVSHFFLMGGLAFFVNLLLNCKQKILFQRSILIGSLFVVIGVTLEEFSQLFIPRRNFDLLDLACDYLGILLFSRLAVWVHSKIVSPVIPSKAKASSKSRSAHRYQS